MTKVCDDESSGAHSALAGVGVPIVGWVGGGGGGGGGSGSAKAALVILFIIIGMPAGWLIQRNKRLAYIADLPTVRMSTSVGGPDVDESGAVRYARGQPQTLRISVNWEPQAVYWSERPLRVTLSRNGNAQYNHLWRHDDLEFNSLDFDITDRFPLGRYLIEASVEGAPPARHWFTVEPRPPGNIFISDTPPQWPRQNITTLQHRPGENKKIFAYVRITGTIPAEGRIVYISLVHEGVALFKYSNRVTQQNRDFYIPYEADFSEGSYAARLWADGEPPAEFSFAVQYPKVETQEEKSRRIAQMLDAILPGGSNEGDSVNTTSDRDNAGGPYLTRESEYHATMNDDFDDDFQNRGRWIPTVVPLAVGAIASKNKEIEMTMTASGNGYIGLASRCKVSGDFEVRVNYKLLNWPSKNFHTVRLMAPDLPDGGTGFPGVARNSYANEDYQFRNQRGQSGIVSVPTSDTSGTIGLRRVGQTLYAFDSNGTFASAPTSTSPTGFTIDFSTPSPTAPGDVVVAFDDFEASATGSLTCPQ